MTLPGISRSDAAPGSGSHDLDAFLGKALEQKPVWTTLYENLRETFFPPRLPPLELTSSPIPVPDRMAARTNPWAVGTATVVNGGIMAIVLLLGVRAAFDPIPKSDPHTDVKLSDFDLFVFPKAQSAGGGGGGGGSNELIDPIRGRLPKFENTPLTPPQVPLLDQPKLAIDPSIAVQQQIKLPDNPSMPNIGVHDSPNVRLASNGPGAGLGIGTGLDGGLGPGKGIGTGPGYDRGAWDGIYTPGGSVSSPIPIVTPEAEFSDEARRNKYQGVCVISLIVDSQGNPRNPRVTRSLGMGLDEKALEAVLNYRFKPAMKGGKPVPVMITVVVNFRLY